jgi:hypothetical protein
LIPSSAFLTPSLLHHYHPAYCIQLRTFTLLHVNTTKLAPPE